MVAGEGGRIKGVSDLIMSPEAVQGLREIAYNPINQASCRLIQFQQLTKCVTLFTTTLSS